MPEITVTQDGVEKLLKNLKPNKAAGPDRISPSVLKELADVLSQPLTQIYQTAIDTGNVPEQWRTAIVTPIFKKGDKSKAANYRPVSLTAICCKLCEHLIARAILDHLDTHSLLSDLQHGFRRKRSCESQLTIFIDELTRGVVNGSQIDAVVMDFSKAFDVVPHGSLLVKLRHYGIRGNTLKWIDSFLSHRTQKVVVDGEMSDLAPVTSGVPQGSVLGPILFLVFINDMPECITSTSRLFADDTIVYREVRCDDDRQALQDDLKALEQWEQKWGMSFNPSKCSIIHITKKRTTAKHDYILKDQVLETSTTANYLGITIACDLSWKEQILKITSKGNKLLGFLRRNIQTKSELIKTKAYNTIVRPTIEYAATVWAPGQKGLINSLEAVQRRAARYVCNNHQRTASVTDMMEKLGWDSLEERRLRMKIILLFKILHKMIAIPDNQLVPTTTTTRGHNMKLRQIPTRTNYYKFSFFPSSIVAWNKLPKDIVKLEDIDSFRTAISKLQTLAL